MSTHFVVIVVGAVLSAAALVTTVVAVFTGFWHGLQGVGYIAGICSTVISVQYAVVRFKTARGQTGPLNAQRLLQHVSSGIVILVLFQRLTPELSIVALGTSVAAFIIVQVARFWSPDLNGQFLISFGSMLKESERDGIKPPGAFYFLLGCFLSAALFPPQLATYAMLCVTFADPSAAIGGVLLGGPRLLGQKTISGFITCCLAGATIAMCVPLSSTCGGTHEASRMITFFVYGLAAGIGELVGGWSTLIDDNLTASFGTGLILWILDYLLLC